MQNKSSDNNKKGIYSNILSIITMLSMKNPLNANSVISQNKITILENKLKELANQMKSTPTDFKLQLLSLIYSNFLIEKIKKNNDIKEDDKIKKLTETINAQYKVLGELAKNVLGFDPNKQVEIDSLKKLKEKQEKINGLELEKNTLLNNTEALNLENNSISENLEKIKKEISQLENKITEKEEEIRNLNHRIATLNNELEKQKNEPVPAKIDQTTQTEPSMLRKAIIKTRKVISHPATVIAIIIVIVTVLCLILWGVPIYNNQSVLNLLNITS